MFSASFVRFAWLSVVVVFSSVVATSGFPGGGTSLFITSDTPVAILPEFTALANSTAFTVELWVNGLYRGSSLTPLEMVTALESQLFGIFIHNESICRVSCI